MISPNFNQSILNLSATLAAFLGDQNKLPKLPILQKELNKQPKQIAFIIFDGLGVYNINELTTNNNLFQTSIKQVLTSMTPPTTTNATTTLIDAKYPAQHLWLAWALWFEHEKRVIELFLNKDHYSAEPTQKVYAQNPYGMYFKRANTTREIHTIFPAYCAYEPCANNRTANNATELFAALNQTLATQNQKFVYCYCPNPDNIMHDTGVHSTQTKQMFDIIQSGVQALKSSHPDTLFIITADHGHIDLAGHINIYEDTVLMDMLARPVSMEQRHASFLIKQGMHAQFEQHFKANYEKDFELHLAADLIEKGVYGISEDTGKLQQYLGDYVAIGTSTNKAFSFAPSHPRFKGHHAGGTREEMEVPLILI